MDRTNPGATSARVVWLSDTLLIAVNVADVRAYHIVDRALVAAAAAWGGGAFIVGPFMFTEADRTLCYGRVCSPLDSEEHPAEVTAAAMRALAASAYAVDIDNIDVVDVDAV